MSQNDQEDNDGASTSPTLVPPHMQDEFYPTYVPDESESSTKPSRSQAQSRNNTSKKSTKPMFDFSRFSASGQAVGTSASVTDDGRVFVSLTNNASEAVGDPAERVDLDLDEDVIQPDYVPEEATDPVTSSSPPPLQIVIHIVGSRGDVQPFVALGKKLQEFPCEPAFPNSPNSGSITATGTGVRKGHRVRIATHKNFEGFVRENGLEFFDVGGDPAELMSYMVKNPGLVPGFESISKGDIGKKRSMIREMLDGFWKSCFSPDTTTGEPFLAEAIIANPPSYAHIHCAEALGIPLHMMFTMPWTATTEFPHPLVTLNQESPKSRKNTSTPSQPSTPTGSTTDRSSTSTKAQSIHDEAKLSPRLGHYLSYGMADVLAWQGLGDIVNEFRREKLGLTPFTVRSGPNVLDRLRVPWSYAWSEGLISKPKDWRHNIDIVGFYFLDLASRYQPPSDLVEFLEAGPPPIYIGFGSIPVEDSKAMTEIIFNAVKKANVRALVSAGWGGLGGAEIPPNVFMLGNVPHDWLFGQVAAVVHHGGAGTVAAGLRAGKPTLVIPFFGDQPWWGRSIFTAGAGPEPIPHKQLNEDKLADGIRFLLSPKAQTCAQTIKETIDNEDGAANGVTSFHRHLPLLNMRCEIVSNLPAVWFCDRHCLKLSAVAAQVLIESKKIGSSDLTRHFPRTWNTKAAISDPLTGAGAAIGHGILDTMQGVGLIFVNPLKGGSKLILAGPRHTAHGIGRVSEGFRNLPIMYGSQIRPPGKITNAQSGVREAGRSVVFGYWDGITDLVTEPIRGAKKEGAVGALKGFGKGILNAHIKPTAGILGAIEHGGKGAWKSSSKLWNKEVVQFWNGALQAQGESAAQSLSSAERQEIVKTFERLCKTTKQRKHLLEEEKRRREQQARENLSTANTGSVS